MIEDKRYNGHTTAPSDIDCADGDLSLAVNLIPEDGALKPILPPKVLFSIGENNMVYIHTTSLFEHYIFDRDNSIYLYGVDEPILSSTQTTHQIYSMGNTLIILKADGMHYLIWDDEYKYLGQTIPFVPMDFGLVGKVEMSEEFNVSYNVNSSVYPYTFSEDKKKQVADAVLAEVNKFIAEQSVEKEKFLFPFFIRYALRLFDGTLTKHSAPILMMPSSEVTPFAMVKGVMGTTSATMQIIGNVFDIDYNLSAEWANDDIMQWSDIVKSVDVFISAPIYTYQQSGEWIEYEGEEYPYPPAFERFAEKSNYTSAFSISGAINTSSSPGLDIYQEFPYTQFWWDTPYSDASTNEGVLCYRLPQKEDNIIKDDISSEYNFYLAKSIPIQDLYFSLRSRQTFDIDNGVLSSLQTREVMTDDFDSHDLLLPKSLFNYNSRLNASNINKLTFGGFSVDNMLNFTYMILSPYVKVFMYIKDSGRDIIVESAVGRINETTMPRYIYYPNTNAYKAIIEITPYGSSVASRYEVAMQSHNFLNGSFAFVDWDGLIGSETTQEIPTPSDIEHRTVAYPNKIYTSEVDNPFYFPVLGINTVGSGNIIAMCASTQAVSQGQFGQYPLYAFSTDGIWALEVSATGTFTSVSPVSRDVILGSGDSLTSLDTAVIYATQRGIMLLSGSNPVCISDNIDSETPFGFADLPHNTTILDTAKGFAEPEDSSFDNINVDDISLMPFSLFLLNCKTSYDYPNQRIVIYNPEYSYAYVYSLKSQGWGMILSDIQSSTNSYPNDIVVADGGQIKDLSQGSEYIYSAPAILVSRPIKIGDPNIYKTIDTIIQRGVFKDGDISQILYGSNDLNEWHTVWSSKDRYLRGFRGSPYKYFRVAVIAKFNPSQSIFGQTIQFTPRLLNKPR